MSLSYASKRSALTQGVPASNPVNKASTWVRPAEWLALPTVADTEQKVVGLVAVENHSSNFLAFTCTGAYTVDWGDGVVENFASGAQANHQYVYANISDATTFNDRRYRQVIVTITPQAGQNITAFNAHVKHNQSGLPKYNSNWLDITVSLPSCPVTGLAFNNWVSQVVTANWLERITIVKLASFVFNPASGYPFGGLIGLRMFNFPANTVLSGNLSYMFYTCQSLEEVKGISELSTATAVTSMFQSCFSLLYVPFFNTSSTTTFDGAFNGCASLTSIPKFDTSSVTGSGFQNMFNGCNSLLSVPYFDTRNGTIFLSMFSGCSKLVTVPRYNTASATGMQSMFQNCFALTSVPLLNTANVTNFSTMFSGCSALTSAPAFNTASATAMNNMFFNCRQLTSVPEYNTANVTTFNSMFSGCTALATVPVFNATVATDTTSMFNGCLSLIEAPALNLANVTTATAMFTGCSSLKSHPSYNFTRMTNSSSMFNNCISLKYGGEISNVSTLLVNTSSMYAGCVSLQKNPWFTGSFTGTTINAANMFNNCTSLSTIEVIQLGSLTTITTIFGGCTNLSRITSGPKLSFSIASFKFSATELNALYTALPTVTGQTITVTGNWGTATDTPSIATAKGWTVTG